MAQRLKRAESRELTRKRLLDAAERLFARDGFDATSVDDVAEAAGFSKGALYYNFESKDELLEALVERNIADLVTSLETALADAHTIEEKLAAAQRLLTEQERHQHGAQLELEVFVQAVRDPKLRRMVRKAYGRMVDAIASLIDEQFARAGVRPPHAVGSARYCDRCRFLGSRIDASSRSGFDPDGIAAVGSCVAAPPLARLERFFAELIADRCELRLHHRPALPVRAVDDERCAGDVGRVRRREERRRPSELARVADTSGRDRCAFLAAASRNVLDLLRFVVVRDESGNEVVRRGSRTAPTRPRASRSGSSRRPSTPPSARSPGPPSMSRTHRCSRSRPAFAAAM